tara:strand:+ start:253 stop:573 length:321 start_codon:yes stop_codon:yes gene_type:complete
MIPITQLSKIIIKLIRLGNIKPLYILPQPEANTICRGGLIYMENRVRNGIPITQTHRTPYLGSFLLENLVKSEFDIIKDIGAVENFCYLNVFVNYKSLSLTKSPKK